MVASKKSCCIQGCLSTTSRKEDVFPQVKFYRFPTNSVHQPWKNVKRRKWINAVQKYVKDKDSHDWKPTKYTTICSAHFIGNQKSEHPSHPSYIPSIFPGKVSAKSGTQAVERFERQQRRSNNITSVQMEKENNDLSEMEQDLQQTVDVAFDAPEVNTSNRSIGCQTDQCIDLETDHSCTYFLCNLNHSNGISTAELQVNIVVKKVVDKMCNVNIPVPKANVKDSGCDPIDQESMKSVCPGFHGITSIRNNEDLTSLAGVTFSVFTMLLELLPSAESSKIQKRTRLLITLMKLKTGLSYSALAVLFQIHRTTAQRIFISDLLSLRSTLQKFIIWPSRATIQATMPEAFKRHYPDTRVIIDCAEVYTEIPSKIKDQVLMYSEYKHHHTVKFLIGCTPCGFVSFLSSCYGGRASDCFITNECGILDLIEPGDVVLADRGFPTIKTSLANKNAILIMPPFGHEGQFTPDEVEETYNIASLRIHIERIIQRIRDFYILAKVPISLLPYINQIVYVICALINVENPIIAQ